MSTSLASAAELLKKIQQEGDNLKNVTSQVNTLKKEIAVLRDEKEAVEKQVGIARVELEELGRKAGLSDATRKKAEEEFAAVRKSNDSDIKATNEVLAGLLASREELSASVASLTKEKESILISIEQARKEWASEVEGNKKHLHAIKTEGIAEQESKEALSAQNSELKKINKELSEKVVALKKEAGDLGDLIGDLEIESDKLKKSISEGSKKLDAATLASDALSSELLKAQKELEKTREASDQKIQEANEKLGVLLTAEQRVERKTERLKDEEKRCRAQNLLRNNFKL